MMVAWTHGCLGIHLWLRERTWYPRAAPLLLVIAVLWPTLALLGLFEGTREVLARTPPASSSYGGDYGYGSGYDSGYGGDAADAAATLEREIYWAYALQFPVYAAASRLLG